MLKLIDIMLGALCQVIPERIAAAREEPTPITVLGVSILTPRTITQTTVLKRQVPELPCKKMATM